jgi:hypothetical protein
MSGEGVQEFRSSGVQEFRSSGALHRQARENLEEARRTLLFQRSTERLSGVGGFIPFALGPGRELLFCGRINPILDAPVTPELL